MKESHYGDLMQELCFILDRVNVFFTNISLNIGAVFADFSAVMMMWLTKIFTREI
jgi:hypothetical protein